ncbi:MAG: hypothetical protein U9P44_02155, partial [archaeon]|nr:hypothetical protein [archaeon]
MQAFCLSRLADIADMLSKKMPVEFQSEEYNGDFCFYGYIVNNKFFEKLSDPLPQQYIRNSGILLKTNMG